MKYYISALVGFLLIVGLAACQSPTPKATPTRPKPTAPATDTPAPTAPATDTPTPTAEQASDQPGATPTTPWQIPKVQPDDWVRGGADAGLILVEYSDFQ